MPTVIVCNSQEVIQGPIKSLFSPRKTIATHTMRSLLSLDKAQGTPNTQMEDSWFIWSLRPNGNGVSSRVIQLSSAKSKRVVLIIFRFPWLFGKNLNWSYLNIFNSMITSIFNGIVI